MNKEILKPRPFRARKVVRELHPTYDYGGFIFRKTGDYIWTLQYALGSSPVLVTRPTMRQLKEYIEERRDDIARGIVRPIALKDWVEPLEQVSSELTELDSDNMVTPEESEQLEREYTGETTAGDQEFTAEHGVETEPKPYHYYLVLREALPMPDGRFYRIITFVGRSGTDGVSYTFQSYNLAIKDYVTVMIIPVAVALMMVHKIYTGTDAYSFQGLTPISSYEFSEAR